MPIWIPVVVLASAVFVAVPVAERLGMPPVVAASLATVTAASALAVVVMIGLTPAVFPEPGWSAWLILVGPTAVMTLVGTGTALLGHSGKPAVAVGRCTFCELPLFADHTGSRYIAADAGYLCPPEYRQPGHRRHRLVRGTSDGAVRPAGTRR